MTSRATHAKVNLAEKLACFSDTWSPRIVGELNGQHVKLAKLEGEFEWHAHDQEDELFLCWSGSFRIEMEREAAVTLRRGDLFVVPRGVEHRPVADEPAIGLMLERPETQQYGN